MESSIKAGAGLLIYSDFETLHDCFANQERYDRLQFNAQSLDSMTKGIDTGCMTEIYGQSGSGKTQLCLQLALNCCLPVEYGGLNGQAIYISTDKLICIKRLAQMAEALQAQNELFREINFLDNIFVLETNSKNGIDVFLENEIISYLKEPHCLKLVIFDSIAGIYRIEKNYLQRAIHMFSYFHRLQELAFKNSFAIIATNHVSSYTEKDGGKTIHSPSIGASWTSLLSARYCVKATDQYVQSKKTGQMCKVRSLKVIFSPRLESLSVAKFLVSNDGIESVLTENKYDYVRFVTEV
jgi:RecA/RadA recombinase